jgi:4'-phosphopantetheinyl transferase
VWLLFDRHLDDAAALREVLTPDERARVARYAEARARSFSGVRATLRALLSRYTGTPPHDIVFSYGAQGKPAFEQGRIHFSVSHAHDRALLAFSRSVPVGIDLERVRSHRRFDALSARFFSADNAAVIARASPSARARIFTEAWAQREAYVKAVGGGLYATPDRLPFIPGRIPRRIVPCGVAGAGHDEWLVATIDAGVDYEAKLVAPAASHGSVDIMCYTARPRNVES